MSAILLLLFANNKNSVFWVSFAFLELSFAVAAVITLLLAGDSKFSFPFELSLITFSYLYIAIVVAIDLLFGWIFKVYLIIYICIHLAVLSAFLIIGILMFLSKRSIAKQNETAYASSYEQQILLGEADRLKSMVRKLPDSVQHDAGLQLEILGEAIRYSDLSPESSVLDIDNRIRSKVFSMACEIDNLIDIQSEDITALIAAVSDIRQLIEARNLQIRNEKTGI